MPYKRRNGGFHWPEYQEWLLSEEGGGCVLAKQIDEVRYAAVKPLQHNWALFSGTIGDELDFIDRWIYETDVAALEALQRWYGEGEPSGWKRHPFSGRLRPDADPSKEFVRP